MKKITFNKRFFWISLIIFLGCFLRLYEETPSSLWTDELATYWISSAETVGECIDRASATQGQSPFYYVIVWSFLKILPHSEFSLRLLSMITSIISLCLIFYLGLLMFSQVSLFEDDGRTKQKTLLDSDAYLPALFSTLLLGVSQSAIYYSHEARPYSIAVMFCLMSQVFFIRMLKKSTLFNMILYIISSSLVCYSHYVFGTLMLTQNVWMLYLYLKKNRKDSFKFRHILKFKVDDVSLLKWCVIQIVLLISLTPLAFHLAPILSYGDKWNWLPNGGFVYVFQVFGEIMNSSFAIFSFVLFVFLISIKNLRYLWKPQTPEDKGAYCCFVDAISDNSPHVLFFLFIWFFTPPLFVYAVSKIGNTSIIATRYMILSLIPLFLIGGWAVSAIKNQKAKYVFICLILFFYSANFLVPNFIHEGRFSNRISHDWRGALSYIGKNYKPGDVVFLRAGFLKENWIPETDNKIIKNYVKCPLSSFYFKGDIPLKDVYNMTFSHPDEFPSYYAKIHSELATKNRVWILAVSKPNNYPVRGLKTHQVTFKKNFEGVFVALLIKK